MKDPIEVIPAVAEIRGDVIQGMKAVVTLDVLPQLLRQFLLGGHGGFLIDELIILRIDDVGEEPLHESVEHQFVTGVLFFQFPDHRPEEFVYLGRIAKAPKFDVRPAAGDVTVRVQEGLELRLRDPALGLEGPAVEKALADTEIEDLRIAPVDLGVTDVHIGHGDIAGGVVQGPILRENIDFPPQDDHDLIVVVIMKHRSLILTSVQGKIQVDAGCLVDDTQMIAVHTVIIDTDGHALRKVPCGTCAQTGHHVLKLRQADRDHVNLDGTLVLHYALPRFIRRKMRQSEHCSSFRAIAR